MKKRRKGKSAKPMSDHAKIKPPFVWLGSKTCVMKWLLGQFPPVKNIERFIDAFGGSGGVSLNAGYKEIVYNDFNGDLVNFFRVLRGERANELIEKLTLTLFSVEELALARHRDAEDEVERARRFFVRVGQSVFGLEGNGKAGRGSWAVTQKTSRGRANVFASRVDALPEYIEWVRRWAIEQLDVFDLIDRYCVDLKAKVLLYCDPPYPVYVRGKGGESAQYKHDASSPQWHAKLAKRLNELKCKVAISNFDSPEYDELFPPPKWRKAKHSGRVCAINRRVQYECLWMNYEDDWQLKLPL